jgi:hypothetical protein
MMKILAQRLPEAGRSILGTSANCSMAFNHDRLLLGLPSLLPEAEVHVYASSFAQPPFEQPFIFTDPDPGPGQFGFSVSNMDVFLVRHACTPLKASSCKDTPPDAHPLSPRRSALLFATLAWFTFTKTSMYQGRLLLLLRRTTTRP